MQVLYFDINIIDTVENTTALSLERTAISSPALIYNGTEDKFQNICTSELSFSFLVDDTTEAKFFELFTASEKRYKVELIDGTINGFPKVVWCGFLLPEQFTEPYEHSNFYVDFVATDGVALLKNKEYNYDADSINRSVLEVINQCLLQTGLQLPIHFTEAVQSSDFTLDYIDLLINTSSYLDDDLVPEKTFTVLENCLKAIGCKLLLFNGVWYIIGLNKFKETEFIFYKYNLDASLNLELDSQGVYYRDVLVNKLNRTPLVTILPPLKKVETVWDHNNSEFLTPEDLFAWESFYKYRSGFFTLESDKNLDLNVPGLPTFPDVLEDDQSYNGYIATPVEGYLEVNDENARRGVTGVHWSLRNYNQGRRPGSNSEILVSDLDTNYLTLTNPYFLYASKDNTEFASLEIEYKCPLFSGNNDVSPRPQATIQDYFELKGNFTLVANNGIGRPRFTSNGHGLITDDQIVIDFTQTHDYAGMFKITRIDDNTFDLIEDGVSYVANGTGSWELKPFKNVFYFAITRKETLDATTEELYISNLPTDSRPNGFFDFNFSLEQDILTCSLKIDKILFQEDGFYNIHIYPYVSNKFINSILITNLSLKYTSAPDISIIKTRAINYTAEHTLDLFHSSTRTNLSARSFLFSDALKTEIENSDLDIVYPEHYLDKFRRYDITESKQFYEVLTTIYHDLLFEYNFKINGSIASLVGPLDIVDFSFRGIKKYYPTNLQMDLSEGQTTVTLVEIKNENVTDYD